MSGAGRHGHCRDPATAGAHLVGADARPGQSCGAGGRQRRVLGTTQERMLREMAEALNVVDGGPAARPGARRPALERLCHPGLAGGAGTPTRTGPLPVAGDVSAPRCAAAGPSAAYGHARAAHAWAVCRAAADIAHRSGGGGLPGGTLPGGPIPGRAGAPGASAHGGQSAVHGQCGGGLGASGLARGTGAGPCGWGWPP